MSEELAVDDGIERKPCPECGEQIAVSALICRFCKSQVADSTAMAEATDGTEMWTYGDILVTRRDAVLPNRCVKTNVETEGRLKRTMYWHTPYLYLLILVHIFVYAIAALIVRKKAVVEIGLSEEIVARRRTAILIGWASFLVMIATIFMSVKANNPGPVIVGAIGFLIGVVYSTRAAAVVSPRKIDDAYVYIKGVCPEYLRGLPQWRGEKV